jgi:hypothetical protein
MTTAALRYNDLSNWTPAFAGEVHSFERDKHQGVSAARCRDLHGSIVRHLECRNKPGMTGHNSIRRLSLNVDPA